MTDQGALADIAEIAKNEKNFGLRKAAVERMTDQSVLADIAKNDKNFDVRWAAVDRVTDQSLLSDIAKNGKFWEVCQAAMERVNGQAALVEIAKTDGNSDVRGAVARRVTHPDIRSTLLESPAVPSDVKHILRLLQAQNLEELVYAAFLRAQFEVLYLCYQYNASDIWPARDSEPYDQLATRLGSDNSRSFWFLQDGTVAVVRETSCDKFGAGEECSFTVRYRVDKIAIGRLGACLGNSLKRFTWELASHLIEMSLQTT
jgi:hypothetical protein